VWSAALAAAGSAIPRQVSEPTFIEARHHGEPDAAARRAQPVLALIAREQPAGSRSRRSTNGAELCTRSSLEDSCSG
jgi:hypothetical protein